MSGLKEYKMSFTDIVQGRDATVRVTEDKLIYAVDLVMAMTGQELATAYVTMARITEDIFDSSKYSYLISPKNGKKVKLLNFDNALQFVMVIPGKLAKQLRMQFAEILHRYMAGDLTLTEEIQSNAQSTAPVAQMARDSLGIVSEADLQLKRRWDDLKLDRAETEIKRVKLEMFNQFLGGIKELDPAWQKDTRFVVQSKDHLKNVMFGQTLSIADAAGRAPQAEASLTISEVAREQGLGHLSHGELCKVGMKARELYMAKHGKLPDQRKQFVDGAERLVNAYTESDRDIIREALRAH